MEEAEVAGFSEGPVLGKPFCGTPGQHHGVYQYFSRESNLLTR